MKDYSNKECCLTCNAFCWWDGDYCCTEEMKIHQFGYGPENGYAMWFTNDIDTTMETPRTCEDYSYVHHKRYPLKDNFYVKEYEKFNEWKKLCKQLNDHVTDKYGVYDNIKKWFGWV